MTKKEENQQNSNINFKIKVTKIHKNVPKFGGLYNQLSKVDTRVNYNQSTFSLDNVKEVLTEIFNKPQNNRQVKILTNQAGYNEFEKALKEEVIKTIRKNEHRKKLDFRSEIFKQTYKFR